jgi:predicted transposase/invertase (TIGR01784 family)
MTYEFDLHESKEEGKAEAKLEMVDAMLANDIPVEKIAVISGFSQEEIEKRRAQRQK